MTVIPEFQKCFCLVSCFLQFIMRDRLLSQFLSISFCKYLMLCAIWYYLDSSKNVKNTHGGVLLLVLKVTLLHGCFSRILYCTNDTKFRKASHLYRLNKQVPDQSQYLQLGPFLLKSFELLLTIFFEIPGIHYSAYLGIVVFTFKFVYDDGKNCHRSEQRRFEVKSIVNGP